MARKNKSSRTPKAPGPRAFDPKDSKISAIRSWEDVADEEDQFHISRDKILFEDDTAGRRGDDDFAASDEEVMALSGVDDDSDSDEDSEAYDESEDEDSSRKRSQVGEDDSDSEIDDGRRKHKDDEEVEGWGSSKKNYYGGDTIETEQDAADEEAEAKRIQSKQLSALNEADFLFDEEEWAAGDDEAKEVKSIGKAVITEALPTTIPESMPVEEQTKLFHARHPEFQPLANEFTELRPLHMQLRSSAAAAEAVGETAKTSVAIAKFHTLTAYFGILSMYFALLASEEVVKSQGMALKDHPVMEKLVICRERWNAVKDLEVEEIRSSPRGINKVIDMDHHSEPENTALILAPKNEKLERKRKRTKLDEDLPGPKAKRSTILKDAEKAKRLEDSFADLELLTTTYKAKSKSSKNSATAKDKPKKASSFADAYDSDDYGEDTHLTSLDAEEKATRRKNLRFYTSQIVSKSAKRALASQRAGGDMDIPHKERRKEKELRLAAEAARRRAAGEGADLDSDEPEENDRRPAKEIQEPDSDLEYYNQVADASKKRKEEKKTLYEVQREAKREGDVVKIVEGEVRPDGKRAIGYTIEKNKGLAPHRSKDVRNPRVKKRKKYEAAKKKLGSKKAIWKGGQQGAYGGEATGIKTNLVKSVKFA
ncbi:something about silencing protein 10 [Rhizina undulata]